MCREISREVGGPFPLNGRPIWSRSRLNVSLNVCSLGVENGACRLGQ